MLHPLIGILIFFLLLGWLKYLNNKRIYAQRDEILDALADEVMLSLSQVKASTFTSGARNVNYRFRCCDLYATENAIVIMGYSKISVIKNLSVPIILSNFPNLYIERFPFAFIITPKKFNSESFNDDVFIEFGESGMTTTNVEIRLEGLPKVERDKLKSIMRRSGLNLGKT